MHGTVVATLLGQSAPPADFIRDHSSIVAWIIGGLLAIVVGQAVAAVAWIHKEFSALKAADAEMARMLGAKIVEVTGEVNNASLKRYDHFLTVSKDTDNRIGMIEGRVTNVEKILEVYKEHVTTIDGMLKRIAESQDRTASALDEMKVENITAHGEIIEGRAALLERVASVEGRAEMMIQKLTQNGSQHTELREIADGLRDILERLPQPAKWNGRDRRRR